MNRLSAVLAVLLVATLAIDVQAQNPRRTERAFVSSPAALGMGDVGVARSFASSSFFYNPAHVSQNGSTTRVLGLQGAASNQVRDQARFYNDRLSPALDEGLNTLDAGRLSDLYSDALSVTATPSQGRVGVLLPALTRQVSDVVGVGGGLFAQSNASFRLINSGLGVPRVTLLSRSDLIGVASVGATVPGTGLSLGTTVKYTKRYLSYKDKPLDTFASDERVVLLEGTNVGVDVGATYTLPFLPVPGDVTVGMSVYDLLHTGYGYEVSGTASETPLIGGSIPESEPLTDTEAQFQEERAKNRFSLARSYRIGASYVVENVGPLGEVAVAADYVGYGNPEIDQSFLAQMNLGARANLTQFLAVRGGFSQGYPSAGLGLNLWVFHLDYALHAFEEGRAPGQLQNYIHTAQFSFQW
jgi:hypothetical protein